MALKGGLLRIACDKIAGLGVPAFIKDSELRFVAVNAAFACYCGLDAADLHGRRLSEITGRPEDAACEDMERRVLVFGTEQMELVFAADDQQRCRADIERFVTEDEALYVFGVFRDRPKPLSKPPQRRAKPEALRGDDARLGPEARIHRLVLDALSISVLYLDRDLVIRYFNRREAVMSAALGAELRVGMSYRDMVAMIHASGHYGDRPLEEVCQERISSLLADLHKPQFLKFSDGRQILLQRHRFEDGALLIVYSDVTEAQKHERESALYRAALENVPEPVFLRDRDRRLIFANAAFEQILGGERTRFYGQTEEEMFPRSGERLRLENIKVLQTGEAMECEERLVMPTGEEVPLLVSRKRLDGVEGGPFIVGTFADVSLLKIRERELIEARQQAEAADQAKSRFLRSISHEIRTPMNGVLGMAELLGASQLDARQRTFVDVIVKSGRALMTVINDLLEFSEISDGQIALTETLFDPLTAAEDVMTLMAGAASDRHMELVLRGCALTHHVVGDAGRFRQLLTLLLRDAIAMSEQDCIVLRLGCRETGEGRGQLEVAVESPVLAETGFNLTQAMVTRLVDLFGGKVAVENTALGRRIVSLTLPFALAGLRSQASLPHALKGARVLVLAERPAQGDALTASLGQWGFDAAAVSDIGLATHLLEHAMALDAPVDIVLVDIGTEASGALNWLRQMRADIRFADLPVVAITFPQPMGPDLLNGDVAVQAQLVRPVREGLLRNALADVLRAERVRLQKWRPQQTVTTPSLSRQQGIDVLVVEQGESERHFFEQVLRQAPLTFRSCTDAAAALAIWRAQEPALILLDLSLPDKEGFHLSRMIRDEERSDASRLPTAMIGMTSAAFLHERRDCLAAGMDDMVVKPLSPEQLIDLVSQRVGQDEVWKIVG
ncbi:PAS domain-containing protein [Rhizobium paknamense]|uniref:histidine kinase n=1 Tax=Rhizobium paknamense TaxID=1206817 RepID=A0ABU0IAS6_9HYPH|nr:PAS domain-containing protein [Rhizobium paknamense]MDQ0454401.1 PAS domain S-box-containing protein [Rhizobium paknamense]